MEQWTEVEVERETPLAEMTGSLEKLAGWKRRRRRRAGLRFIAQRPVCALFIEGASAFKHKECILDRKVRICCNCNEFWGQKESRTAVLQSWWKG